MSTEAPVISPPSDENGPEGHLADDQKDGAEYMKAAAPQSFAEQQGPNILLLMGVVLFLFACGSLFSGHSTVAAILAVTAVTTVVVATGLARLEVLKLEVLKLIGFLARFRSNE